MFVYNEALAWELVQKHQQLELTHATMQFLARTRLGLVCFLPSGLRGVSRSSLAITCRCNYWHLGLERFAGFCSNM